MRPWPTLSALVRHTLPFMRRCVAGKGRAGRCARIKLTAKLA